MAVPHPRKPGDTGNKNTGSGNTSSGGGTSSSSGSSSSSSAAAAAAKARAARATRIAFLDELSKLHVKLTDNLQQLVNEAVKKQYTNTEFLYWLRKTPDYKKAFVGIFDAQGFPRMSETEYLQRRQDYTDALAIAGLPQPDRLIKFLFKNDVSLAVLQQRVGAVREFTDNNIAYQQFQAELHARGEKTTPRKMAEFIYGMGDPAWYSLFRVTQARTEAATAGLHIGEDIKRAQILQLLHKGLDEKALGTGFSTYETALDTFAPLGDFTGLGLSKQQAYGLAFGTPQVQAAVRSHVQRILGTFQAQFNYNTPGTETQQDTERPQVQ